MSKKILQGKPENRELSSPCQPVLFYIWAGRTLIVPYYQVFPVSHTEMYCFYGLTCPKKILYHTEIYCFYGLVPRRYYLMLGVLLNNWIWIKSISDKYTIFSCHACWNIMTLYKIDLILLIITSHFYHHTQHTEIYCFYGLVPRRYYLIQKTINTNSRVNEVEGWPPASSCACARERHKAPYFNVWASRRFYEKVTDFVDPTNSFHGLVPRRYYLIQKSVNTTSRVHEVEGWPPASSCACARKRHKAPYFNVWDSRRFYEKVTDFVDPTTSFHGYVQEDIISYRQLWILLAFMV